MRITFLRDEIYEAEGPNKGPAFAAGDTYDCVDDFGGRWVHRGAAERVGDQQPKAGERWTKVAARKTKPGKPAEGDDETVSNPSGGQSPSRGAGDDTLANRCGDDSLAGGSGQDLLQLDPK